MKQAPSGMATALAAYQAGRFADAVEAAEGALARADVKTRQNLLVILANSNLKLGRKVAAAEAFVSAAAAIADKRALFLQFAVNLFADEGQHARTAAIAADAARLHRGDPAFLYRLAMACKLAGALAEAESFIADLDLANPQHFALLADFETAIGDADRFYLFLAEACRTRPQSLPLNSLRYARAINVADLDATAEFSALQSRNDAAAEALCRNELAWSRLMRTDDERVHGLPSYDTLGLHRIEPQDIPARRRTPSKAGEKIRIGYLSNDFHWHATMILFEEVMQAHDRERFEITLFCYTDAADADYQRRWPVWMRDAVVPVRAMTDAEAAQCIAAHGINILVDLKGFTTGARLGILNRSDAPVKVTYLGYPGSLTGMDVDYAITDPIVTPDTSKPFYTERLCRLPETYQANGSRNRPKPLALTRDDLGLPNDRLVFGSFNSPAKITMTTLDLWADILRRVPDSVFCLLCRKGLPRENLAKVFASRGVAAERLIFFSGEAYDSYLSRIAAVDLALDAYPCNGHTTTSDILWAGTPLVTFKGGSFASRVSESLLTAVGLPDLVADDAAGFADLAVALAGDRERLAAVRARLAVSRVSAPLFDTERFARHLERAYEMMIERARAGLGPDHIDVPALPARGGTFLV
ncbi:O-linked N-acetylglucosamine transferase, SPINDLY family protein [Rhizobium sp. PAMB 3174]